MMDDTVQRQLDRFASMVADSEHNLVSRRARGELTTRHVPECAAFAEMLPAGPARLLDLGAGGGLPGMVVAVTRPDLQVELLDATAKKTAFLAAAAADLGVDVVVHTGRAEELGSREPLTGAFDVVTARAVAALDRLIPLALPFLRPGGLLYAIKGERWREELETAAPVLARTGMSVVALPDDPQVVTSSRHGPAPMVVMLARAV